ASMSGRLCRRCCIDRRTPSGETDPAVMKTRAAPSTKSQSVPAGTANRASRRRPVIIERTGAWSGGAVGLAAAILILSGCDASPSPEQSGEVLFWGDSRMALASDCSDDPTIFFHDPVSIEPYEGDKYLVANYANISMVDVNAG